MAVSIPDEVYQGAESLARRSKKSRSRLISDALRRHLARHAPDEVTDAMDRAYAEAGPHLLRFRQNTQNYRGMSSRWGAPEAEVSAPAITYSVVWAAVRPWPANRPFLWSTGAS